MIEVSVVLPIYNRGNVVSKVLKTLESQSFKSFELIIVDDGSSDDTKLVCDEFCIRNENWNLFSISHVGVSKAREFGIKKARGKYISFVDSDDFLEVDFLKILHENVKDVDVSMCNYRVSYGKTFCTKNFLFHRAGKFEGDGIIKSLVSDISVKSFLCNKMFKKELFDDVFIPKISCCEDKIMCVQLLFNSKKIRITQEVLYNYYKNSSSLTWKTNEEIMNNSIYASEFIKDFLCSKGVYHKFRFNHLIFCFQIFFVILDVCFFKCIIHEKSLKKFCMLFVDKFTRLVKSTKLLDGDTNTRENDN